MRILPKFSYYILLLVPSLLWGAAETIRPSAINDLTNYNSGDDTDIVDDPDSPDANWLCNDSGCADTPFNTNTSVDVEFDNPANPPVSTTDAQEVAVFIRRTNHPTAPTCTIDIKEGNTVRVAAVIVYSPSNTAGVYQAGDWTFVPGNWTDTSGDSIEVGVNCVHGGSSPGDRAVGELGAVELNLDTSGGSTRQRGHVIGDD